MSPSKPKGRIESECILLREGVQNWNDAGSVCRWRAGHNKKILRALRRLMRHCGLRDVMSEEINLRVAGGVVRRDRDFKGGRSRLKCGGSYCKSPRVVEDM